MSKQTQEETITIPLKDLLWLILGTQESGSPCNPVPKATANILSHKLKDSLLYKLDYHDVDGNELEYPKLWWYRDWKTASSTYAKQKAYSERMRIERWLLTANIEMVMKAIMKKTPVTEQHARDMAYTFVKNPDGIIALRGFFGVDKLKSTVEEL